MDLLVQRSPASPELARTIAVRGLRSVTVKLYIAKRLCEGVATIWIVTLLVFALLRITGNPVDFLAPPDMPWTDRAYLREAYGLDKPVWQQYLLFNKSIIMGDFGKSLRGNQGAALDVLLERVPATMQLTAAALLFSIVVGITAGVVSAARPNSIYDRDWHGHRHCRAVHASFLGRVAAHPGVYRVPRVAPQCWWSRPARPAGADHAGHLSRLVTGSLPYADGTVERA